MRLLITVLAVGALTVSGCAPTSSGNRSDDDGNGSDSTSGSDFGGFVDNTGQTTTTGGGTTTGTPDTTGTTGGDTTGGDTTGGATTGGGTTGGTTTGGTTGGDTTGGATTGGGTTGGTTGGGTGAGIGAACTDPTDCDGDICIPVGDGYCSVSGCDAQACPAGSTCFEFNGPAFYCLDNCSSNADCGAGQICDADNTCWPGEPVGPTGNGVVGDACESDADCTDAGATCYPYIFNGDPTGFVNGYCIIFSCTDNSCPGTSTCMEVTSDGGTACVSSCAATADCRADEGYACFQGGICFPGCSGAGSSCPSNYACDAESNNCLPSCTPGSCTGGLVCNEASGYCDDPPCTAGSCASGYLCSAASGKCVPDLTGGPTGAPGPACSNLPPKDCTGTNAYCGELMQFTPPNGTGYTDYPLNGETWENQYRSFARRDMIMLIKWATAYVDCKASGWGGGNGFPLGLGDMSEANGAIPGTSIGSPGHPANTHEDGYDMDIAYYQNAGNDNYLKAVCDYTIGGANQYHCVSEPYLLDVWRTALFLGALFSSERTRVIGVDGQVGTLVSQALQVLCADGWLPAASCVPANQNLACEIEGEPEPGNICWKENGAFWFNHHHHHLHLSLWGLSGKPGAAPAQPCLTKDCSPVDWEVDPNVLGYSAVDRFKIDLAIPQMLLQ